MQFKQLFKDERAVSPVIGVILMVAITVILAAVIGTFVLGLGNNLQETSPNTNFQFDYNNPDPANDDDYTVVATHEGGQTIDEDNANDLELAYTAPDGTSDRKSFPTFAAGNGVSSGDSAEFTDEVPAGSDVRVIWTSPEGGNSQTLAEGQVPS